MSSNQNHNMNHLQHLESVALTDVAQVREKERTYQGSWKRQGGKNAWAMIRRKIDRLMIMLGDPTPPETFNLKNVDDTIKAIAEAAVAKNYGNINGQPTLAVKFPRTPEATTHILEHLRNAYVAGDIFAQIEAAPSGDDGTVLAEVRDLRRYLLLVEAEIMARNHVPHPFGHETFSSRDGVRVKEVIDVDDSRHASLFPWQVHGSWLDGVAARSQAHRRLVELFYRRLIHDTYILEPFVESPTIPQEVAHCYILAEDKNSWIIRIENVPEELRGKYPNLHVERNAHEFGELPDEMRELYTWMNDELKYRLKNLAWHVEA